MTINYPFAIMYVATLAAIIGSAWLWQERVKSSYRKELDTFRGEVNQLAASIGLMKRGPPMMRPPVVGG